MNERIKALEVQCWEPRKYGPAWFDAEKFAGLIVRECTNILDIQGTTTGQEAYHYSASLLEEYFGVES